MQTNTMTLIPAAERKFLAECKIQNRMVGVIKGKAASASRLLIKEARENENREVRQARTRQFWGGACTDFVLPSRRSGSGDRHIRNHPRPSLRNPRGGSHER